MAAEVSIFLVSEKLKNLLAEEKFIFPGLRNRIRDAINELEKILSFLEAETISDWEDHHQLLQTIFLAEKSTDHFILRTAQRQRRQKKGLLKLALGYRSRSQQQLSSEMEKLVANLRAKFPGLPEPRSLGSKDVNSDAIQSEGRISDSLVGRGDAAKDILARLIDEDGNCFRVIPLVSEEAGFGKTALARNIYNRVEIRRHFKWRGWVNVRKDAEYKDILAILFMQTPICILKDAEQMNEIELSMLLLRFLMEHRFLIVLDDFWSVDVWRKLVRPFADSANGSRVILTTRKIDVVNVDPWSSPIKLSRLTEEASWELFLNKVRRPEIDSSDYDTDLKKILRKCQDSPPAIVLMGGLLSTTESNEWSTVIDLANCGEDIVNFCHHKLPSLRP